MKKTEAESSHKSIIGRVPPKKTFPSSTENRAIQSSTGQNQICIAPNRSVKLSRNPKTTQSEGAVSSNTGPFFPSTRLYLALLSCAGSVVIYALRVNLSLTIVCMVNHTALHHLTNSENVLFNYTQLDAAEDCSITALDFNSSQGSIINEGELMWDKSVQGTVLGAFFWGYVGTQILGGWLAQRIGPKVLLGVTVSMGAVLTLLTPLAAHTHLYALLALRAALGLAQGVTYPAFTTFWAQWAPPMERSKLTGLSNSGAQVGNVLALPISGLLCDSSFLGGWPAVYYIFGGSSVVWVIVWFVYTSNSPQNHRWIKQKEKLFISATLSSQLASFEDQKGQAVPWLSILRSMPVWAAFVGHFAADWGAYTMFTCLPSFMSDVLRFDISALGMLASIPYVAYFLFINIAGFATDMIRSRGYLSTKNTRKAAMLIGLGSQGVFLLGAAYCQCGQELLAMGLLSLGMGLSGFQFSGFSVNYIDIAPAHAGLLLGIGNTVACLGGILAPFTMGILTPNKTRSEWLQVFWLTAGIMGAGLIFFLVFADGEVQPWALSPHKPLRGSRDTEGGKERDLRTEESEKLIEAGKNNH